VAVADKIVVAVGLGRLPPTAFVVEDANVGEGQVGPWLKMAPPWAKVCWGWPRPCHRPGQSAREDHVTKLDLGALVTIWKMRSRSAPAAMVVLGAPVVAAPWMISLCAVLVMSRSPAAARFSCPPVRCCASSEYKCPLQGDDGVFAAGVGVGCDDGIAQGVCPRCGNISEGRGSKKAGRVRASRPSSSRRVALVF